MRLVDLDPEFLARDDDRHFHYVDDIGDADGVWFLCPKCFAGSGRAGTHSVLCWAPNVPQTTGPQPGRWELTGTGLEDLTLVAGSSSVQLIGDCQAHFFIRNGEVLMA